MTQAAPSRDSLRAQAAAGTILFERLEYGKLCASADGPILPGSEAYPQARSVGFPPWLEAFCHPAQVGVGPDLPVGVAEGWVIRSVRGPRGAFPLACRLRRRPEDGERGGGRHYWLGRYVASPDPVADPDACFRALAAEPLRGITLESAEGSWLPLAVAPSTPLAAGAVPRSFLSEAVVLAIAAVPIGLAVPELSAAEFFRWATALWSLLPPGLRPALATGWGVAPPLTPALNLSLASAYPPGVAVFDLRDGSWRHPAGRGDIALIPGRMYVRECVMTDASRQLGLGRLDHLADLEPLLKGSDPPQLADLRSGWTASRFQLPGLRSLDYARVRILRGWLVGPEAPQEPQGLCLSTSDYFTAGARRQILGLATAALESGLEGQKARGDRVLWATVERDPRAFDPIDRSGLSPAIQARIELYEALVGPRTCISLNALLAAMESGVADDLPSGAEALLARHLKSSLAAESLVTQHAEILGRSHIPGTYLRWARQSAGPLALALAGRRFHAAALRALEALSCDPFVSALASWQQGQRPGAADAAALHNASEEHRAGFARLLLEEWKGLGAERREILLEWLERVPDVALRESQEPLPRIALAEPGRLHLDAGWHAALAEEIGAGRIPPRLLERVAAFVLKFWEAFAGYDRTTGDWKKLVALWPARARLALLGQGGEGMPGHRSETDTAFEQLALSSFFLQRLLDDQRQRRDLFCQAASVLWELCSRSQPDGVLRAPDLCSALAAGHLPEEPVDLETACLAADLVRGSGFISKNPALLQNFWSAATQGWQMLLFLESAPQADLEPTVKQLEALFALRRELALHLGRQGTHPARRQRFEAATLDFHQQPYPERGKGWRPEYKRSFLWAAYQGVPFAQQGDLRKAVHAYAEGEDRHNRSCLELAGRYLASYQDWPEGYREAVGHVVKVVAELAGVERAALVQVAQAVCATRLGQGKTKIRLTVVRDDINALQPGKRGEYRIADWFRGFLLETCDRGSANLLLGALQRCPEKEASR